MPARRTYAIALLTAVLALPGSGCAALLGTYRTAPNGLAADEDRLRQMLSSGHADAALQRLDRQAPDDDVLSALYEGVVAYYAGDYASSADILDIAGDLADDRITKSISRSALSLVSNDLALPWEPGRTERLMIPYYAALARVRLGDIEGAAVEARRLSLLLQQTGDAQELPPRIAAMLHLVAAAMFEANGNHGEAGVARRSTAALDSTLVVTPSPGGGGTVFVILEQGFVAHRVEQGLAVMLLPEEVHAIAHGEGELRAAAAGHVAGRVLAHATSDPWRDGSRYGRDDRMLYVPAPEHTDLPRTRRRRVCTPVKPDAADSAVADSAVQVRSGNAPEQVECVEREEPIDEAPYLLKVSWPVYQRGFRPATDALLSAAADTALFAGPADLSLGVVADFERERALIVARTIARGATKLALAKGAEKRIEEKNEVAGRIVGLLGNLGSVLLERADTRSWHLLPAGVSVARIDLPPGEHTLSVEVGGRMLALEPVTVTAGGVSVVPVRAW